MSQEKVDRYKKEKANRKKTVQREKVKHFFRKSVVCLIAIGLVGWLGYSAYSIYESNKPRPVVSVNYNAITNYLDGLDGNEAE